MRMEEYLSAVTEQIRCQRARGMVSGELRAHILDQAEAYEAEGMFEEEALEKAVRDMGDPVETGVRLDRIHRPQTPVELLILIGIISAASVALHAVLGAYTQEIPLAGYGYLKEHVLYVALGYAAMLLVCRLDYSVLAGCAKPAAAAFLGAVLAGMHFFGLRINGALLYMNVGPFRLFLPVLMLLYVPLFGGILYAHRGEGWRGMGKLLLWALVPLWIVFRIPAFSQGAVLWAAFLILTAVAIAEGWYRIRRAAGLAVLGVLFCAPLMVFFGAGALGRLAAYQAMRVQAFLSNDPQYHYQAIQMRRVLAESRMMGGSAENLTELVNLPGFNSDYIFVSLISACGLLAGVLAAAFLLYLILKIFRSSMRQRNRLGRILGCGCGVVYLLQMGLCVGMNLGLLPTTAAILPFFSRGGSGIVSSYVLLGLALSVYRYKNILPEQA